MVDPVLRRARVDDLAAILRLSGEAADAADPVAATMPGAAARAAFDGIDADPTQMLVVAEVEGRGVCAVLHVGFEPAAAGRGERRTRLLGLRVEAAFAQAGLGRRMHDWAVERACERGLRIEPAASDAPGRRPAGRAERHRAALGRLPPRPCRMQGPRRGRCVVVGASPSSAARRGRCVSGR